MAQARTDAPDDPKDSTAATLAPNVRFWRSQLDAAREAAKRTNEQAQRAWQEYLGESADSSVQIRDQQKAAPVRYPIYWASVRTIQPALYSRTPVPVVQKAFDSLDDNVARLASLALERLAKYLMRACPFDRVMYAARDTYIHASKATCRVCFEAQISDEAERTYYAETQSLDPQTQQPVTAYIDDKGMPPPQGVKLYRDDNGQVYAEETSQSLDSIAIIPTPVHYRDSLHTPNARQQDEIWWMAFREQLMKDEVEAKFGAAVAKTLSYAEEQNKQEKTNADDKTIPVRYVTIWEIWNKKRREVYWLAENHDEFIEPTDYEGGDPYDLDDFFPCPPFMVGTVGPDSLYPTPDYIQLEPSINQLHGMARRLKTLVRAARRRGIFDSSVDELVSIQDETDEAEFIGIKDFKQLVGDGGLEKLVSFFPTEEIVAAINQMAQIMDLYENKFNEIYGIPDILRGVSDPNETAAAQQLKGKYLSLRFSSIQREFQRLVRDTIEMMCDLACKKFPASKLADVCGVGHWEQQDQQLWPQVLLLLQDDDERKVRIDIETDSTITMNEDAEIEQRNYLAKTLFEGISAIAAAAQQVPELKTVGLQTLAYVIRGLRKGKEIEESLQQAIQQAMQPQQQQQQPDPNMIKAQSQAQAQQVRAQADIAINNQKAQAEIQRETIKTQHGMQLEQMHAQHDVAIKQLEAQMLQMKAMLDAKLQQQKTDAQIQQGQDKQVRAIEERAMLKQAESAFTGAPPGGETVHLHLAPETNLVAPPNGTP